MSFAATTIDTTAEATTVATTETDITTMDTTTEGIGTFYYLIGQS